MSTSCQYTTDFFQSIRASSSQSAAVVVPLLIDLIHPTSVIDIGCGPGTWLHEFENQGVADILGVDGDYVAPSLLQIPQPLFISHDLRNLFSAPRQFDLALCLEVAEHLPAECADVLIDSLVRLAPVVAFSAAVPHQGGTDHRNEQWPEYWAAKFQARGFVSIDYLRPRIWNNDDVAWWFAQNMILYVEEGHLHQTRELTSLVDLQNGKPLSLVHPRCYLGTVTSADKRVKAEQNLGVVEAARRFFAAGAKSLRSRLKANANR